MPCVHKQSDCFSDSSNLTSSSSTTTKSPTPELSAKDVDELVKEIQEKLAMKNNNILSKHASSKHSNRVSPYSFCDRTNYYVRKSMKTAVNTEPYALLQELLNEGSLIKEAVRRLQLGNSRRKREDSCSDQNNKVTSRISSVGSFSPLAIDG